jgi:hypothetical protein
MRVLVLVLVLVLVALAGCADEPRENPRVVTDDLASCGASKRLVTDVCTQLGSDDGCVDVDDVCIALCDGRTSCTTAADDLRVLSGWPTAPNGYCVECSVP